jgi:hypothetical protein
MSKVKIEDIHTKKTPKSEVDTPLAKAFGSIRNYSLTMKVDLLRKRKKVT